MTPQELKNSILQLAIQGKLVVQRPEEGTAKELFAQIQQEKQRLIAEKKIKKEKSLPEITDDEKPFDIPENWMWVRFGDISTYNQRKQKVSANDITEDMWSLDLEDIEKESGKIINIRKARERKISGDKVQFYKGQVLYSKLRPYLKKILVAPNDGICSSEIVPFNLFGNIDSQYVVYFLKSPHVDFIINSVTYGVKMPRVGTETMVELPFPLPPLAEQKRIVAKIEELLPYIDRYEQAWSKLEQFNSRFPEDMKKSLLQYAIQGKLVEQRAEEGTAEELFAQIQAEKQRLIKEGKIKKEKPLPEITENEKPFDIPESWKWVRVQEITCLNPKNDLPDGLEVSFIPMALVDDGYRNKHTFEVRTWGEIKKGFTHFAEGDIGIAKITPCFQNRKSVIFRNLKNSYGAGTTELSIIRVVDNLLSRDFLLWFFKSPYFIANGVKSFTGTAGQQRIHKDYLSMCVLPLPPLAEQKRIVEKLKQLLPLCERLK